MHLPLLPIVIVLILVVFVAAVTSTQKRRGQVRIKPRAAVLTEREQAMYQRLIASWTGGYVLAQVSMHALMTAPTRGERNRFDRKVVDFVLTNRAFKVCLVIELDDRTHATKKDDDQFRDELLARAGYATRRFANIPDRAELDAILQPLAAAA